mgnify:FL=1
MAADLTFDEMMEKLEPQRKEFDALDELIKAYKNLPAIVDDDYPECRHVYEIKIREFLEACKVNKSI